MVEETMRTLCLFVAGCLWTGAKACSWCRPSVQAVVYGRGFFPNLGLILLPLGLMAAAAVFFGRLEEKRG